jgi:nucleoid-associated protein YgaU
MPRQHNTGRILLTIPFSLLSYRQMSKPPVFCGHRRQEESYEMQRRLIRIEACAVVITVCCGLWVLDSAMAATPQSVESIVQQRMDAGTATMESAADSASQETPQGQTPSAPSSSEQPAEQPAPQAQPTTAEEPSSTAGDNNAEQPEASTPPAPTPATEAPTQPATAAPAPAEEAQSPSAPAAAPAPEAEVPTQSESAAAAPPAVPATEVAQSETQTASPTYTVMPGDTLWSISSLHLSDPFNWPKLWNVNPSVANPDLIYPGNILMLPSGKPVEAVQAPAPPVAEVPPAETQPEETAKEETPPAEEEAPPPAPEEQPAIAQEEPAAAAMTHAKELLIQSSGFIAKSLPVSARVVGTFRLTDNDRTIFSDRDTIYLLPSTGASLEENGRYTIYRRVQKVVHPVTGRVIGDLIEIIGEVEVREAHSPGSDVATGVVVKTFAAIERGDAVMPTRTVEAAPTTPVVEGAGGSLNGWILAIKGDLHMAGELNVVYIDRGESSGVVVGDHFRVYKKGQRTPAYAPVANVQLPDRQIGELEILSVQGETATAVLTKTTDTVALGDRIER